MNEDEIIKELKILIGLEEFNKLSYKENKAIKSLLDLYQKEKEKNKKLENADLTNVYLSGFYDGEKKWKDKIREKIKEYQEQRRKAETNKINDMFVNYIDVLEELLEENNGKQM